MIVSSAERLAWFQSQRGVTLSVAHTTFLDTIQPWVERACWTVIGYSLAEADYTEFLPAAGSERPPLGSGIDIGWDMIGGRAHPRGRGDSVDGAVHLKNLPVRSVASVYENLGAWITGEASGEWPAATLLSASAYRLDMAEPGLCLSGRLYRNYGNWPSTPRVLKVTYHAGYSQAEIDAGHGPVKMAVLTGLNWWWGKAMRQSNGVKTLGLTAMQLSIRDFSVTLADPASVGQSDGVWAQNILGPDSLNVLQKYVNLVQYIGN